MSYTIEWKSSARKQIRIGGYRVLYDIRDDALVVLILRVGSRGSVYRRLDE